jgi:GT2 family glycosyltransferase
MASRSRSFVIPVLDLSPHSPYNINTLLVDLKNIDGEVICIFNSSQVFEKLQLHPRIDKFCFNSLNAGVSRSWNIGINLSEADAVFILNADMQIKPQAIEALTDYLFDLEDAVIVGPQGGLVDFENLTDKKYYSKGSFDQPIRVQNISGFFFAIHRQRFLAHHLSFDVRYSPCFMEEWDIGLQVIKAGLASYVVPVSEFEHDWGISSSKENASISYFGRTVYRDDTLLENRKKFLEKWFAQPNQS